MKDLLKSIALFLLAAICNKIMKDNLPNLGYKNLKKYWDNYLQWISILLLLFFLLLHTSNTYPLPTSGLLVMGALAAFQSLYAMTEIKKSKKVH